MTSTENISAHYEHDPTPLGVTVDPQAAAKYDDYAADAGFVEIYELWCDPQISNPTVRQRAVAALTAPYGYDLPYPHEGQSIGSLLRHTDTIRGEATHSLRRRLVGRTVLADEVAAGVLYWLDVTKDSDERDIANAREAYQTVILELLPIVNEEMADRLFKHYFLNDVQPFMDADDNSGYNPLTKLLQDSQISTQMKETTLQWWFGVAEAELEGKRAPRQEHERAVDKMAQLLQTWSYSETVDKAVFASMVTFLEEKTPEDLPYIMGHAVGRVARHFAYASSGVRFSFGQRHILSEVSQDGGGFAIETGVDRQYVEWLRQVAAERGRSDFVKRAGELIDQFDANRQAEVAKRMARLALKDELRRL